MYDKITRETMLGSMAYSNVRIKPGLFSSVTCQSTESGRYIGIVTYVEICELVFILCVSCFDENEL